MLVDDLKEKITYRELLEWIFFLSKEEERETKQDYYLAQIATEVRRGQVKNPRAVKVKDFLLKFEKTDDITEPVKQKVERSKSFWMTAAGVKK